MPAPVFGSDPRGTIVRVRVQPRASRNEIAGFYGDALKVRVTSPPVDGAANDALCAFFARLLHIAPGRVSVKSGQTGRDKVVLLEGVSAEEAARLLKLTKG